MEMIIAVTALGIAAVTAAVNYRQSAAAIRLQEFDREVEFIRARLATAEAELIQCQHERETLREENGRLLRRIIRLENGPPGQSR
jgi:septal ring factor EnvC (AmiA/AmiB activator)